MKFWFGLGVVRIVAERGRESEFERKREKEEGFLFLCLCPVSHSSPLNPKQALIGPKLT